MTTLLVSDLVVPATQDEMRATLLALLAAGSLPTTSWQSTSVPRAFLEIDAKVLADLSVTLSAVAKGGFVDDAAGDWLTLLGRSNYQEARKPAVFTAGNVSLTDVAGAGPYTITAGQLWFVSASGRRFTNSAGGTLPQSGSLALPVRAESAGALYNEPAHSLSLSTPLPGVTVSNASNWITTLGTDEEVDESLRARLRAKWATLGNGATKSAYDYWAKTASAQVTRTLVLENTPGGGQVTVYIAGPTGDALPTDVVTAVDAYVQIRKPLAVRVYVLPALSRVVPVVATVTARGGSRPVSEVAANAALTALNTELAIGEPVRVAELIQRIMDQDGVINVAISAPAADVALYPNEIAKVAPALSWVTA